VSGRKVCNSCAGIRIIAISNAWCSNSKGAREKLPRCNNAGTIAQRFAETRYNYMFKNPGLEDLGQSINVFRNFTLKNP
jgi:hypothetical protein